MSGNYMRRGDLYLIWDGCERTKQAWFYLHDAEGVPVFCNKWPPMADEKFCTISLSTLNYKFICSFKPEELNEKS